MGRKLDLRTGRPVWSAYRAPSVHTQRLTRDIATDVLVVGMGISGAIIAHRLAQVGRKVVVIDRRGPLEGSTAATTALVQFEIDQPLSVLIGKIGRDRAERAWRRSRLAVLNLKALIERHAIECRLAPRPSLYLSGNVLAPEALKAEAECRRRAGLDAAYLPPKDVLDGFGIEKRSAVLSHDNLALDPRKLTAGLLLGAANHGARLYAPVEALGFTHDGAGVEVETRTGPVIRANHLIAATGYELMTGIPHEGHEIISTYAIATKLQKQSLWPRQAFIWEASEPYLYMRATPDGRVICGGEDEPFQDEDRRDALLDAKAGRISAKLAKLHPNLDATPEFTWAGSFGTTATGLPIIGPVPGKPRVFAIMGYGGNGITYSQIAAEVIANALDGQDDSDANLYAFP